MKRVDQVLESAGLDFWNRHSAAVGVWRVSVYDVAAAVSVLKSHGYTVRVPYGGNHLMVSR